MGGYGGSERTVCGLIFPVKKMVRGECGFDGVLNCAVLDGADKLMS